MEAHLCAFALATIPSGVTSFIVTSGDGPWRYCDISQFWQKSQRKLQPGVAMENAWLPEGSWMTILLDLLRRARIELSSTPVVTFFARERMPFYYRTEVPAKNREVNLIKYFKWLHTL